MGKSTFLSHLVRKADHVVKVVAYHICMADNQKTLSASEFVLSIARMLSRSVPGFKASVKTRECKEDPVSALVDNVLKPLASCKIQGVHCIVIDSLDEALHWKGKSVCL